MKLDSIYRRMFYIPSDIKKGTEVFCVGEQ